MSILKVVLFGEMRVSHDNWQTEVTITRESQTLLAYLLLNRHRFHSREVLADMFWGEHSQQRARGSLNTALWKLKKALEPEGIPARTYLKNTHLGGIGFNEKSQYWLDVKVFEDEMNQTLICPIEKVKKSYVINLENVLELYQGDLLEGVYDNWVLPERERLRTLYLNSLTYLMQYYGFQRMYEKSIACGKKILDLDPLREEVHREMMRLYLENGQRALAVRQYDSCCAIMSAELGIYPRQDIKMLYRQIVDGGDVGDGNIRISKERMSFDKALRQLRRANKNIDLAKEQIHQALQLITQFSKDPD